MILLASYYAIGTCFTLRWLWPHALLVFWRDSLELMSHGVFCCMGRLFFHFEIKPAGKNYQVGPSPFDFLVLITFTKLLSWYESCQIPRQNDGSQPPSSHSEQSNYLHSPVHAQRFTEHATCTAAGGQRCRSSGAVFDPATRQKESLC